MKVKEDSVEVGLKLNIHKTKIMASSPITSWEIDGENSGNSEFYWAPKLLQIVTAAMKLRHLLLGRKAMSNLDSILKSRDIALLQRSVSPKLWFFQWSCMDVRVVL